MWCEQKVRKRTVMCFGRQVYTCKNDVCDQREILLENARLIIVTGVSEITVAISMYRD